MAGNSKGRTEFNVVKLGVVKKSSENIKHIILCRHPLFLTASEKRGISTEIRESTALENPTPTVINAQKVQIQVED